MGVAETYADYMPSKCEYALHLLPLSTSLLSFVLLITNWYLHLHIKSSSVVLVTYKYRWMDILSSMYSLLCISSWHLRTGVTLLINETVLCFWVSANLLNCWTVKLGKKHPDPVVETASLSSVAPTDVWYKMTLPEETMTTGALSALQLEAITYAAQQHEHFLPDGSRAGFLIGE